MGAVEEELAKRPVRAPHGRREKAILRTRSPNVLSGHLVSKLRLNCRRGPSKRLPNSLLFSGSKHLRVTSGVGSGTSSCHLLGRHLTSPVASL